MSFRFLDQYPVYLDASGQPCAGGSLSFFDTGTTNPRAVYTNKALSISAANPLTLNAEGRPTTDIWGSGSYRVVLKDASGDVVWTRDDVDELLTGAGIPTQTGNSGKFLTTNGSAASWSAISQVPSQTGSAGKYLKTDGTTATWANPNTLPTTSTVVSASTITPDAGSDGYSVTALAAPLTIANPTGTWADLQGYVVRIKDDGTARALTFGTNYRAVGITLPTTTVAGKEMYIGFVYNVAAVKWDVTILRKQA